MSRPRTKKPWMFRRENGTFYASWHNPRSGRNERESLRTKDPAAAEAAFAAYLKNRPHLDATEPEQGKALTWAQWSQKMCRRARENAKAKGRQYAISPAIVEQMILAQDARCAVTGIELSNRYFYRNPFAPSLDQVLPGGGYLPGNIRVVSVIANTAMNGWGEKPLLRLIYESRFTCQWQATNDGTTNCRVTENEGYSEG